MLRCLHLFSWSTCPDDLRNAWTVVKRRYSSDMYRFDSQTHFRFVCLTIVFYRIKYMFYTDKPPTLYLPCLPSQRDNVFIYLSFVFICELAVQFIKNFWLCNLNGTTFSERRTPVHSCWEPHFENVALIRARRTPKSGTSAETFVKRKNRVQWLSW